MRRDEGERRGPERRGGRARGESETREEKEEAAGETAWVRKRVAFQGRREVFENECREGLPEPPPSPTIEQ